MKNDRHRAAYIPFRCPEKTQEAIRRLAAEQRKPQSVILRQLVEEGLSQSGSRTEEEKLAAALELALKPHVERLASISAKATQISGAAYFMSIYLLHQMEPDQSPLIEEAAGLARKLGVEYLKLAKDRDLDEFLKDSTGKLRDRL